MSSDGSAAAVEVLQRLLHKGERARTAGRDETVPLTFTGRDAREYGGLPSHAAREAFHARIALAERAGAITVKRERPGDAEARLLQLRVASLDSLAGHLDIALLGQHVAAARQTLAHLLPSFPSLEEVLALWQRGRSVRGSGPLAAADLADAAKAVLDLRAPAGPDRLLRKESRRLFGDSKRLQQLTRWLEVLHFGETTATGLEDRDIWSALGLRPMPQPLLLAGRARIAVEGDWLAACHPWIGLPPGAATQITTDARWLLTIENLTSFHEAALQLGEQPGLLLWTAGMPSPALRQLYALALDALPANAVVYHWGDIDVGGYRIAALLADSARAADRQLQPWRMSPDDVSELPPDPPSTSTVRAMQYHARRAGWEGVATALEQRPLILEQEHLTAALPH
ncbi:Wadjet anti-phage system protein JetD domain-containing protein [Lysobacter olei]